MDDVSHKREKSECCPPGHAGRYVALYNLANGLRQKFLKELKIDDLDEAITLYRDSSELRPVERAITIEREVLALRPPGHPDRDAFLHNLGFSLRMKFEKQAKVYDLEEAIQLLRAALEICPPGFRSVFDSFLTGFSVLAYTSFGSEQVYCYQEQWEIYKLDPAYRCTVFGGNKLSSITRVSQGNPVTPRLEPSGVKRSCRTSPEPAPQKRVRHNHTQSSTLDDSDGTENTEKDEIESMPVDEDGPRIPRFASNRKPGRVSREEMYAERQWRWRINRVVQEKYDRAPPVPTETSFSMQSDSNDSSVSPPAVYNTKRKGDSIAPHNTDGVAGSEVRFDRNAASNKRMRVMSKERTCQTTNHRHITQEKKRLQKIIKLRQRRRPDHGLPFEDDLRFEFEPNVDDGESGTSEGADYEQTSDHPANDKYDPEAARQAKIAESIRKLRELEKDRPLWEEQRRLREARELA